MWLTLDPLAPSPLQTARRPGQTVKAYSPPAFDELVGLELAKACKGRKYVCMELDKMLFSAIGIAPAPGAVMDIAGDLK